MLKDHLLVAACAVTVCAAVGCGASAVADWQPADGPLMTPFAKDVSPAAALPEYPRPQMVRQDWQNLNGLWQWAPAEEGQAPPVGKDLEGEILVPYPIESALSGVMEHHDRLWYRRTFQVPGAWRGGRVLLHFGAVDWEATVYVNGRKVAHHRGGYDPFTCDVTDALTGGGEQELIVAVYDPTNRGDQPRGKQVLEPKGIWYTPVTGIWRTVWMEPVPERHIMALAVTPDVDEKALRVKVIPYGFAKGLRARVTVTADGKHVGACTAEPQGDRYLGGLVMIPTPRLWSPDDPFLYDLKVELLDGGRVADTVDSYFGMRKIEIGKGPAGKTRILLNGKFVFQVGPLDQGWWPDGLYTAATDEALRYDVEVTKKLGFNFARKHVKVEPERWYYWCDKLGLMVWQDMPNGNNKTPEGKKQFERELRALVEAYRNHPAIIMWVVFNEGWGQHDTERYVKLVKGWDPTRLVSNASGWADKKCGDILDVHSYPKPKGAAPEPTRAAVQGEFGGLGLGVPGHLWKEKHWGYRGMADADELTRGYEELMQMIWAMKDAPGLSAAVYTQTSDCEIECNGLMTYDRAVIKPDVARVAAVNRGDFSRVPPPPVVKTVAATSEQEPQTWRYTTTKPPAGWTDPGFDDSGWKQGPGGFGTKGTPGAVVGTVWKGSDIWLRRQVDLPGGPWHNLRLRIHHDEDAQVFVSGVKAAEFRRHVGEYQNRPMDRKAAAAVKPGGKVVIAVHCRQTKGGQFIDVGLVDLVPQTK